MCGRGGIHGRGMCGGEGGACMAGRYAAAGGMHPTGMHSCSAMFLHCFTINVEEMGKDLMIHF